MSAHSKRPSSPSNDRYSALDGHCRSCVLGTRVCAHSSKRPGRTSALSTIARGTLTSAHDVLSETANGLVRVKAVALVSAHSRPLRYAKYRMRYLLDLLFELREAVDDQTMRTNAWVVAQYRLARKIDGARTVRMGILNGLARVVRLHDDVAQEVANARGQADHAPAIAASLEALAGLIEAWEADADKLVLLDRRYASISACSVSAACRAVNELSAPAAWATRSKLARAKGRSGPGGGASPVAWASAGGALLEQGRPWRGPSTATTPADDAGPQAHGIDGPVALLGFLGASR